MLVLLRLSIGWHFHSEGSEKYRQGDWDAAPFFANAKGPLADEFRKTVWDYDGTVRRDPEFTRWWLEMYRDRAADYYTFGDKELAIANEALETLLRNHEAVLQEYADELEEYDLGRARIETLKTQEDRVGVESLAGQIDTVQKENDAKLKPVLGAIDELWAGYEGTINSLAAPNQRQLSPPLELVKPRTAMVDTSVINRFVPYFDLAVGWCLLLGLFTPVAALAAAGFLGSVFLSQYPPGTGPTSSNYQLIECMACLVLAGTGAGRFAGLDFFIHLLIRRSVAKRPADT
ncbi:DoxX family protein [Stieleria mannarensis]|uniref:DoxX family protein n=1 Tax=Stieleria mannarensis TaxID=2755585 RepID=UPI00257045AF|nr:DoxX family protein [Rhodopirellula sp. JC639]